MFRTVFLTLLAVSVAFSTSCIQTGMSTPYVIEDDISSSLFEGNLTCGQTPASLMETGPTFAKRFDQNDLAIVFEVLSVILEMPCCEKTKYAEEFEAAGNAVEISLKELVEDQKPVKVEAVVEDVKAVEKQVVEESEFMMPQFGAYLYPQLPKTSAVGFLQLSIDELVNFTTNSTNVVKSFNTSANVDDWYNRPLEIEDGVNITNFVDFFTHPVEEGTKIAKTLITIVGVGFIGLEAIVFMLMVLVMLIPVPDEDEPQNVRPNPVPLRRSNKIVRPRALSELVSAVEAKKKLAESLTAAKTEESTVETIKTEKSAAVQDSAEVKVPCVSELEEIPPIAKDVPSKIPLPVVAVNAKKSKDIFVSRPRRMSLRTTCISFERIQVVTAPHEVATLPKIEERKSEVDVDVTMDDVSSSKA